MNGSVTALLVSHDGSRWLSQVLDQLTQQTVAPTAVVAVDTGSLDSSADLLRERAPGATVLTADRATSYPAAVRLALARLDSLDPPGDDDWVWLLHDDSAPAPDALEHLLAARTPSGPEVLGPKIREWPSLRRLVEVGVTISGTGQRETGLERGEHDQGQHDEPHDVLAVNTAGMLVRRSVLAELGLDDELPVIHSDLDFGWRAARAGFHVLTVPEAVIFHAEASGTGIRRPELGRGARRRVERRAALYTVLANCAVAALPFVAVRLLLGTLLRALALLLVRAPREAWAELGALGATVLRPARILRARRARRRTARRPPREVRGLLAPVWLPYRNGLDELAGIAAAVVGEAGARTSTADGRSIGSRLGRSPLLWVLIGLTGLALVAGRDLLAGGRLAGGALLPAPDSALAWWRSYLSTTHEVATGSAASAPAYLLPLAVVATVLLGSAAAAVELLLLGAVPLAGVGGYRFLRHVTSSSLISAWGAVSYALLLATSGALAQGRVGTLVAAALLPWLAASAAGLVAESADRRRRAAWRTALWLALSAAFAPMVILIAAVVTSGGLLLTAAARRRDLRRWGLALVPVPVAAVLLLPWSALVWPDRGWSGLLLEAGLPASGLVGPADALDVLAGRATDVGAAPVWITALTGVVALLALLRGRTRRSVLICWLVALAGLAAAWLTTGLVVDDLVGSGTVLVWSGLPILLLQGAWLTAAAVGAGGLRASLGGRAFGWRQPVGLGVVALALVVPVCGTGWWVWRGSDDPVGRTGAETVPAYMDSAADRDAAAGTLVLRGRLEDGLTAEVRRGSPMTLGEEALLPSAARQEQLTSAVGDLVTTPTSTTVRELAQSGVAFVFVPAPVDADLAAALDAVPALAAASADDPVARAWRLDEAPSLPAVDPGARGWLRPLLLAVQGLALLVVIVLAAPTRRRRP